MGKKRILVVDDEEDLCEILKFNLEIEGYEVVTVHSAKDALTLKLETFNLFLLDVMMGEISGYKLAQMLTQNPLTRTTPIIFITAKDTENDTITGFAVGADDYISKPFSIREVILRVKAVLRRTQRPKDLSNTLVFDELSVNKQSKRAFIDEKELVLTKKEFEILSLLLSQQGTVLSRKTILDTVWNDESFVLDRTVDVNITRLRKKMGRYGQHIVTRLGYGYCFDTSID